ncbi:MAG: hypothetical protein CVV02_09255 [Firmicutes bacterium HGW-Firmicutes-7]|nr:MAG: hypothetical protein CVV02_09255 [Firmicutes bacterium HGW-Firmicutes-7]
MIQLVKKKGMVHERAEGIMNKIVFVILHFNAMQITIECIESIFKFARYDYYSIVVVDNKSPNGTGISLKEKYLNHPKVHVILLDENIGFAKGNNVGYKYAKETLEADFIIIPNNDTEFIDDHFIDNAIRIFNESAYGILGPNIISARTGAHQNPHKKELVTREKVVKAIRHYKNERIKHLLMSIFNFPAMHNYLRKMKKAVKSEKVSRGKITEQMTNVTLFGACIVYSPLFIEKFNYAFYPEPFMYYDEDLLHYACAKQHLKVIYDPSITIYHKEKQATQTINRTYLKQRKFVNKHITNSIKILYRLMKEDNYYSINDFK